MGKDLSWISEKFHITFTSDNHKNLSKKGKRDLLNKLLFMKPALKRLTPTLHTSTSNNYLMNTLEL